jgi:TonB family protein
MRTFFVGLILLLWAFPASAQHAPAGSAPLQSAQPLNNHEPFFPKGDDAMERFVNSQIQFSPEAKTKGVKGEVVISFDVRPDSTITNAMIISGPGFGIEEEVKRIVERLRFAPALHNGQKIRMNIMHTFPVSTH